MITSRVDECTPSFRLCKLLERRVLFDKETLHIACKKYSLGKGTQCAQGYSELEIVEHFRLGTGCTLEAVGVHSRASIVLVSTLCHHFDDSPTQSAMNIQQEQQSDKQAVHSINTIAFGSQGEADLVDSLREQASPVVSLVAQKNELIIGHIMFSPVSLSSHPNMVVMGLAPMAVLPEYQRTGVGSALIYAGIEACKELGAAALVVLGHPAYYPKFGFVPSSAYGIVSQYDVPEDVFMVLELDQGALAVGAEAEKTGTISYHRAFSDL